MVIEAAGSPRRSKKGSTWSATAAATCRRPLHRRRRQRGQRPPQINRKHLEIRGCWGSEPGHFLRALTFLERYAATVPWHAIGARAYPLQRLNEALADAEAMRITKALVDPWA